MAEERKPTRKRIPVTINKTFRQMTPDEEKRFMIAVDGLIGELVYKEMDRRSAARSQSKPPTAST